jgi:N-acetylmuramoyl-L-alanine amidase
MSVARVVWCFLPLTFAFLVIVYLEEKINRWFAPFSGYGATRTQASGGRAVAGAPGPAAAARQRRDRARYRIVLDPGHGGRGERRSATGGDGWDPVTGEFLISYMNGGSRLAHGITYAEHEIALALGRRIKLWLDRTADEATWPAFEALVRRYQEHAKSTVKRVDLRCVLTREHSYLDHPDAASPDVNKHFRLFDSPDTLPAAPGIPMFPGRLSRAAALAGDLFVSLHVNDSVNGSLRGPTALFVPPFEFYDSIRQMVTGARPWVDLRPSPYFTYWSAVRHPRNRRDEIADDATRYFLEGSGSGSGSAAATAVAAGRRPMGRHNRIQWAYRDPRPPEQVALAGPFAGAFWDRERGKHEAFRRSGGPEEVGGDNLFAGQQLIRFMRHALWRDFMARGRDALPAVMRPLFEARNRDRERNRERERDRDPEPSRAPGRGDAGAGAAAPPAPVPMMPTADVYLGRHAPPLCSDWLVALYSNSVVAYLEVAYLSNPADLWLLDNRLDLMAEGIAVGIYSLFAGLKVKDLPGLPPPRGTRLEWEKYADLPGGRTYPEIARASAAAAAAVVP